MQNKTTIEINGRIYDAKSGTLLSGSAAHGKPAHRPHQNHQPATHQSAHQLPVNHRPSTMQHMAPIHKPAKQFVDGFVRGTALPAQPTQSHFVSTQPANRQATVQPQHHAAQPRRTEHHSNPQPHHAVVDAKSIHQTQHKSETLMRKAVKQPKNLHPAGTAVSQHPTIMHKRGVPIKSIHGSVSVSARSQLAAAPKERLVLKAGSIDKSHAVSHFGTQSTELPADSLKPMAVKLKTIPLKAPSPEALAHHSPDHAAHAAHATSHANHTNRPATNTARSHAMLQRGLMAANSHEQHRLEYKKHTRRTLLSVGAGTLAALILAGYIAYINIPNIAMRVAASKAGFSASLPDNPSGYSMKGPIKYSEGRITFSLRSNSSDNAIAITESASNWDSQSLLKNHVRPSSNGDYEAVEASGRTLYLYNSSVTWVHAGVWFQIDGNDQVGRDQLVKLATSM